MLSFFASDDEQPLQGAMGHGTGRAAHALCQRFGVVATPAHVGEDQQRVVVKSPVTAQFLVHWGGQWNQPVFVAFAVADEQLVFLAADVVNGQAEAFA